MKRHLFGVTAPQCTAPNHWRIGNGAHGGCDKGVSLIGVKTA